MRSLNAIELLATSGGAGVGAGAGGTAAAAAAAGITDAELAMGMVAEIAHAGSVAVFMGTAAGAVGVLAGLGLNEAWEALFGNPLGISIYNTVESGKTDMDRFKSFFQAVTNPPAGGWPGPLSYMGS